jgi:hypothetical protein
LKEEAVMRRFLVKALFTFVVLAMLAPPKSWSSGDSNCLGTETNLGLTWRFSTSTAFDLVGGYLFAGSAFDAAECRGGRRSPALAARS